LSVACSFWDLPDIFPPLAEGQYIEVSITTRRREWSHLIVVVFLPKRQPE
jgi:hypothetical protein